MTNTQAIHMKVQIEYFFFPSSIRFLKPTFINPGLSSDIEGAKINILFSFDSLYSLIEIPTNILSYLTFLN